MKALFEQMQQLHLEIEKRAKQTFTEQTGREFGYFDFGRTITDKHGFWWTYEDDQWKPYDLSERRLEFYDNDDNRFIHVTPEQAEELKAVTASSILSFLHDNAVGKTCADGKNKFIPRFKVGGLSISIQCSYQIWKRRYEQGRNDFETPISEEEFERMGADSWWDVQICWMHDGKSMQLGDNGQLTILELENVLYNIAVNYKTFIGL